MSEILPLDRDAALRKMLSPDWQKKKDRRVEHKCVDCGKIHLVERTVPRPRCQRCARLVSRFNGRRKP